MLLEHYIVARENASVRLLVRIMAIAVGVPLIWGVLVLVRVMPGALGQGVMWLVVSAAIAFYFLGWRIPVQYVLTDTHLLVKRGFVSRRWVPLDQIQIVSQISRDDTLICSGYCALGECGQPIIINPHHPAEFRVALTPSSQFIENLFWLTSRKDFDPLPVQESAESEW